VSFPEFVEMAAAVSIPIRTIESWDDLRAADFLLLRGKRERPTHTERKWLNQQCGWKDVDRGGAAQTEKTSNRDRKRKIKNRLETNRPSHG